MSYVGKIKDLVELYLAELTRDGLTTICEPDKAKELLMDFAQWLDDDVEDIETDFDEGIEVWGKTTDDNSTDNNILADPEYQKAHTEWSQGIRSLSAWSLLAYWAVVITEPDITLRFGTCKDEEESDDADSSNGN